MLKLQERVESRYPQWFAGKRRKLTHSLLRHYTKVARVDQIEAFLAEHAHLKGLALINAALEHLDCRYLIDPVERQHIPEQGRVIIAANHPMGGVDALALLACVGSVRRDVRIVGNQMLGWLGALDELLIPVPVFEGKASISQLNAMRAALEQECAVIIFPAGEVSRLDWRGVKDGPWRPGFVRLAQSTSAPILPMRIEGRNSALFYSASAIYKPLGTALLPREMFASQGARLTLRAGAPCPAENLLEHNANRQAASQAVRRAVETLSRPQPQWRAPQAIDHSRCLRALRKEIEDLPLLGTTADGKRIHAGRLASDSVVLHEIGRLRELTFRQVGEGTGRRRDLDRYDSWYEHIVLWDEQTCEIAGAYRAAAGARILEEHGLQGLYSASLFHFQPELHEMVASGVELGRSFVSPKYWGSRSLDYLWYGIGAWLRQHPQVRYLFGPVSISASLPLPAQEWLVAYYSRYYGDTQQLAASRHPFRYAKAAPEFSTLDADAAMHLMRAELERLGARVPTLYKQYVDLCEPGGVSFLAFGVDPAFNHSIDGLVRVDLNSVKPRKRARYL